MGRPFLRFVVVAGCLLALSGVPAQIASAAADPNKVLHVAIEAGDDGFDPSRSTNYYSGLIEEVIFERLLTYDYLAEPVKLVPMLAEAMPEVGDGGKTYTFHCARASILRRTLRSKAISASSSRKTSPIRSSASSIRRIARLGDFCSMARSSA
jgi:ABC-type oligopeptide transport system substrate-binding subunit